MTSEEALTKIQDDLQILLCSAIPLVRGEDEIVGYQIKTGALHRIIGTMQEAGHSVTVPLHSQQIKV